MNRIQPVASLPVLKAMVLAAMVLAAMVLAVLPSSAVWGQLTQKEAEAARDEWTRKAEARQAIREAILDGDAQEVKRLVAEAGDPNWVETALRNNQPEIAKMLLEMGAKPTPRLFYDARFVKAPGDRLAIYRLLLDEGGQLANFPSGRLKDWIDAGKHELLAVVIESFQLRKYRSCPLTFAGKREDTAMLRELLQLGFDKDGRCEDGTPLTEVAKAAKLASLRVLIEAGADLETVDEHGATPLYRAAARGWVAGVQELIKAGADVNNAGGRKRGRGKTAIGPVGAPVEIAAKKGLTEVVRELKLGGAGATVDQALARLETRCSASVLRVVLRQGTDPDSTADGSEDPLLVRFAPCGLEVVEPLLKAGVDIDASSPSGETPLMAAAKAGKIELVNRLIELGAKVDARDREGQTALFKVFSSPPEVGLRLVKALELAGADLAHVDERGRNALTLAAKHGRWDEASYLLDRGLEERNDEQGRAPCGLFWDSWSPARPKTTLHLPEADLDVFIPAQWTDRFSDPESLLLLGGKIWPDNRHASFEIRRTGVAQTLEEISPRSIASDPSAETFRRDVGGHSLPMARARTKTTYEQAKVELTMAVPVEGDVLLLQAEGSAALEFYMLCTFDGIAGSVLPELPGLPRLAVSDPAPGHDPSHPPTSLPAHGLRLVAVVVFFFLVVSAVALLWMMMRRTQGSPR